MKKITIYLIAFLSITYGVVELINNRFVIFLFLHDKLWIAQNKLIFIYLLVYQIMIPIIAIIGGVLLIPFKEWGRRLITDISIIAYLYGLSALIIKARMVLVSIYPWAELKNPPPVEIIVSYWRSEYTAVLTLLILFILTRPKIKEQFKP